MYVVMNFGVFVCSGCAGIHRELNHKVKGISMSNFTPAEITFIEQNGNAVSGRMMTLIEPTGGTDVPVVCQDIPAAGQERLV